MAYSRDLERFFGPRHYAFQFAEAPSSCSTTSTILARRVLVERQELHRPDWREPAAVRAQPAGHNSSATTRSSCRCTFRCSHQDAANPSDNTLDRRALLELLSGRPHTVSFAGHMHTTEHHYLGADQGFAGPVPHHHHVLTAASGSWWCGPPDRNGTPCADSIDGTPNGFHVLSVDGSSYTTRFVPAFSKSASQMRVMVDGPHRRVAAQTDRRFPCTSWTAARSSPTSSMADQRLRSPARSSARLGAAAHAADFGPGSFDQRTFRPAGAVRKPWVEAAPSTHLWKTPVPAGLKAGAYSVSVRAVDEYGRQHVAHTVLEIAATRASATT